MKETEIIEVYEEGPSSYGTTRSVRLKETIETTIKYTATNIKDRFNNVKKLIKKYSDEGKTVSQNDQVDLCH